MKIWTSRSSPRSGSQNAWTRIKTVNGAIRLINIWNFFGAIQMISCRDWWPWTKPGYITMTWRQTNNQCSGGIAAYPAPKFPSTKIRWKYLAFFEIKTAFSLLIIFQRAILSTRSITHFCWCKWRTFWREIAAGSSTRWFCTCTIMPRLTGHLQHRTHWPIWASNVLTTHPNLRIRPRLTTTCYLVWKKQMKVPHYSTDALVNAAP